MRAVLDAIGRPEYTGERRCWPCTVINAVILAAGTGLVWFASTTAAFALAVCGAVVIWLRGYLVPYTPQFAPWLAATLPGPFDYSDDPPVEPSTVGNGDAVDGDAVVAALLEAGVIVVEEGSDGERLKLSEGFSEQWYAAMRSVRELNDEELAAAVLNASPGAVDAEARGRSDGTWIVLSDGSGRLSGETWLSRHVAVAETAAVRVLTDTVSGGDEFLFAAAARPLRTFLQRCPICEGDVIETTTTSCCGGAPNPLANPTKAVLACVECDRRVYTFEREVY